MSAQTEKKPERKSKPPERTSSPPGKTIGGTATQRLNKELGNMGGLVEAAIDEKVGKAAGPVKEKVDELESRMDKNDTTYNAALGATAEREEKAKEEMAAIEMNTRTLEGVKDEFGEMKTKFVEHSGKVEQYKVQVDGIELTVEQLQTYMKEMKRGAEFRARELEHDFKEKVERIEASTKAEVDKLSGVFLEAMQEFELVQKAQKGISRRLNGAEKAAEDAKKTAMDALTVAHDVEQHIEGAKQIADDVSKKHDELSSEVSGLGREVDQVRTSLIPPAPDEEAVGEPSGIARVPPPPVRIESGKKIEIMLEENDQMLDEKEVKISEMKEITGILLEVYGMEGIKETEEVKPLDVTKYPGYEKLTDVSKERLLKLAGQATKMREQGAELKALYEAAGRLARKTGVEMKTLPPREAKEISIEKEQQLDSTKMVNGEIANAIKEISTELKKQSYKAIIIYDGLNAVANVNMEGESA